jgi:hypothetical protein
LLLSALLFLHEVRPCVDVDCMLFRFLPCYCT